MTLFERSGVTRHPFTAEQAHAAVSTHPTYADAACAIRTPLKRGYAVIVQPARRLLPTPFELGHQAILTPLKLRAPHGALPAPWRYHSALSPTPSAHARHAPAPSRGLHGFTTPLRMLPAAPTPHLQHRLYNAHLYPYAWGALLRVHQRPSTRTFITDGGTSFPDADTRHHAYSNNALLFLYAVYISCVVRRWALVGRDSHTSYAPRRRTARLDACTVTTFILP